MRLEEILERLEAAGAYGRFSAMPDVWPPPCSGETLGPAAGHSKIDAERHSLRIGPGGGESALKRIRASDERLQRVLRMKLKGQVPEELLPNEKRRLANYLRQRGFFWEDIMEALQKAGGLVEE